MAGQHCCIKKNLNAPRPSEHPPVIVRWGFCADYVVKFASPSCVRFISFGFLLATTCVWVWMVCSLHSVTTGSRDRAYLPLIIIPCQMTIHY